MSYHLRKGRSARTIRAARAVNPQPTPVQVPRDVQRYYWQLGRESAINDCVIATTNIYHTIELASGDSFLITPAIAQALVASIIGHVPKAWCLLQFQIVRSSTSEDFPLLQYTYQIDENISKTISTYSDNDLGITDGAITCFSPPYNVDDSNYTYFPNLRYLNTDRSQGVSPYMMSSSFRMQNTYDWMNNNDRDYPKLTIKNTSNPTTNIRFLFKAFDVQ